MGRLIVWLVCWLSLGVAAAELPAGLDESLMRPISGAWKINASGPRTMNYALALGSIEKVNGIERPEQEQRLTGRLTRLTYRVPEGFSTNELIAHYRTQLLALQGQIRFSCSGRACGSSNVWANRVFNFAKLYGIDRSQRYLVVELPGAYLAVYAVERGNGRLYLHLDLIETNPAALLSSALLATGFIEVAANSVPDIALLADLAGRLQQQENKQERELWLVVHHQGITVADAQHAADEQAAALTAALTRAGQDAFAVRALGRLAPSVLGERKSVVILVLGGDK